MPLSIKISPAALSITGNSEPSGVVASRSALIRRPGARAFDAGRFDRTNGDWKVTYGAPNADIRSALTTIRARARDIAQNNDYAKGYLRMMKANLVGPHGFSFRINPKISDQKFRDNAERIQDKFLEWCEPEYCFLDGEHDFVDGQLLNVLGAARDGEFCVRLIRNKTLRFGFTQQIIPVELLDDQYNEVLPGNRIVIMGVEYDTKTLKKIGYWFRDVPLEYQVYGSTIGTRGRVRFSADEIIFAYDEEFINQTRGVSWMVQSMSSMRMLSAYDEATLIAARMRAMLGGFLKNTKGQGEYEGDSEDEDGNFIMELENGIFKELPQGYEVDFPNSDYPSAQYGPYTDGQLRKQSVGLGVAGSVYSGNYSDVNFSSERARQISVRDNYMLGQQWFIRRYLRRIGRTFMTEGYLTGEIVYPMAQEARYMRHVWSGRRWAYVNPEQEMNANAMKYSLGTKSISEMIWEGDGELEPEEVFQQIASDNKMAEKYGITISPKIQPAYQPANETVPAKKIDGAK